jgi:preprotein translocase subunit SecG
LKSDRRVIWLLGQATGVCYNEVSFFSHPAFLRLWVQTGPERKWWNWQTHHLEGVAPKGVGVQIPPSAPSFERILIQMLSVLITIVHVIVCAVLIVVVLLQHGKSADIAATFGGMGSQTAFGPRGTATVFSRLTTWCAIIFMITSMALTYMTGLRGSSSIMDRIQTPVETPKK